MGNELSSTLGSWTWWRSWWRTPPPPPPTQKEVDEMRRTVIRLFDGQQLLLVGPVGSGKSSLINSINHVINLEDPHARYQELARISSGEANHGTVTYRSYIAERTLFHALKETNLLPDSSIAPRLFDVAGVDQQLLDNGFNLTQLLIYLLGGQVREYTEMIAMFNDESALNNLSQQAAIEANRAWSMICVISLSEPFPRELLEQVHKALNETESHQGGKNIVTYVF